MDTYKLELTEQKVMSKLVIVDKQLGYCRALGDILCHILMVQLYIRKAFLKVNLWHLRRAKRGSLTVDCN